jgi:hypothetical protein
LGCGTVFKITPSGMLATLHTFSDAGIVGPTAQLTQDTNGNFYGTAVYGGSQNCTYGCGGTFGLSVGLAPFVETEPGFGKVGAAVRILGTNLTGANSVTFNGVAATFKLISGSLISTSVPAGATTGTVQVVTPRGTLTSNVNFQLLP